MPVCVYFLCDGSYMQWLARLILCAVRGIVPCLGTVEFDYCGVESDNDSSGRS